MRKTCLHAVYQMAQQDSRVVFIGSDLGPGTLSRFQQDMPERFFMEGVSEQHIIGMAAGLALEGLMPFVNTIATFITRRCYEQVAIDLCLQNLPVRLIGNGGGVVYAPLGPTHLATDDLALMRVLPNMTVLVPADAQEMAELMPQLLTWPGPVYIRLAKGGDPIIERPGRAQLGQAVQLREGRDLGFIATGIMTDRAIQAADLLAQQGIDCGVLHLGTVKPLDQASLVQFASKMGSLMTLEEHSVIGGLGDAVRACLAQERSLLAIPLHSLGLADGFAQGYGSQEALLARAGLDVASIARAVFAVVKS